MLNKSMIKTALFAVALLLVSGLGVQAQKTDCSQKTEKDIVLAVYEKMKAKYADQISNVNVRFKDGVVTIEGWVSSKKAKKDIEKFARKIDCVTRVVNDLAVGKSGGCGPGYKECGGACIPEKEVCNVCLVEKCD